MKLTKMLFRAWFYFRTGYSLYIAFPLGFISTVIVVYSLAIKPAIESGGAVGGYLQTLFPHLVNFVIIGAVVLTPIAVSLGLYHMKRTGAFEADAWRIGNVQQAVLDGVGLLQDWVGPVLPFEPVCGLGDPHHVRGDFRIEMGRHRDAGSASDRRRTQPAGDAADAHEVRHHQIARFGA